MNSLNFTANLVARTQIPKRSADDKFSSVDVSIVELNGDDANDLGALYKTYVLWKSQGRNYSAYIYNEFVKECEYVDVEQEHYYALTAQNNGFECLDSEKILGLALFTQTKFDNEIEYLQVRPNTNTLNSWKREYKGVGSALVNFIISKYNNEPIVLQSVPEAVEFYKKMGFKQVEDDNPTKFCYG